MSETLREFGEDYSAAFDRDLPMLDCFNALLAFEFDMIAAAQAAREVIEASHVFDASIDEQARDAPHPKRRRTARVIVHEHIVVNPFGKSSLALINQIMSELFFGKKKHP